MFLVFYFCFSSFLFANQHVSLSYTDLSDIYALAMCETDKAFCCKITLLLNDMLFWERAKKWVRFGDWVRV